MSSSDRPICRTFVHTGFIVSSKDLSIIFLRTTISSIAIANIFSPFFRLAALRTFAGITTCPLEDTLVVEASTIPSPFNSKNILTYIIFANGNCHVKQVITKLDPFDST
jgi:hypothetical protein